MAEARIGARRRSSVSFRSQHSPSGELQDIVHTIWLASAKIVFMLLADQALHVVARYLGSRRPRGKPPIGRYHLQPANRRIVSWSAGQTGDNRLTGELCSCTTSGERCPSAAFCSAEAGTSNRM